MEIISLKLDEHLLKHIDASLKKYNFSTRTEFVRDAIRRHLRELEKQECLRNLALYRGSLKGKAKMSDEEAGELAIKKKLKKKGQELKPKKITKCNKI